ncbi:DUF3570 domain-containing protein [Methylomonas rhizoryzae]|uniref:DUF3570 domain-containing protein n=1 Tax=Methylomonas rhizoryzae TaxID=2608981 RepID=UPI001E4A1BA6|nr:DUF3570 domain-containing protein [Methylomonas rhizoryzae]
MAVIDSGAAVGGEARKSPLQALTLAALALPGLLLPAQAEAENDEAAFEYSYYQEGFRNQYQFGNQAQPIRVDSLNGSSTIRLADRIKLGFDYIQDTWSGATPITTVPAGMMIEGLSGASAHVNTGSNALVDANFNPLQEGYDSNGNLVYRSSAADKQMMHMLTSASPETRKQGNVRLGYVWDEAELNLNGGVSSERDYDSSFIGANGRWDLNQKLTSLNAGLSYTDSSVYAQKMVSAQGYIDYGAVGAQSGTAVMGDREDWSGSLGVTQVLNKHALLSANLGFTRSSGYLSNPYKASTFVFKDPNQAHTVYPDDVYVAEIISALENRPAERNQFNLDLKYVQYVQPLDAALHLDYRFFQDDWAIAAHTFSAAWEQPLGGGWTVTPKVRYYTQDAADFYQPVYYFNQAKPATANGGIDFSRLPVSHFSSDHRLSGYGALSGGLLFSKTFAKGITFDAGFEYYKHGGGMKLGGGGEDSYADFDYYLVNAGFKVNLEAVSLRGNDEHAHHHHAHQHHDSVPAGVMFGHMMQQGKFMVGYRYMYGRQAGGMLQGSRTVGDSTIAANACGGETCATVPAYMNMHMHMLNIMYAPTDWLNLMVMPQFMDMNMALRPFDAASAGTDLFKHATGGVGDTGLYAMFKLFDAAEHQINTTLGVSAPTGDYRIALVPGGHNHGNNASAGSAGYIHYGMQLGSGTWDFLPSLTYTGSRDAWSWGAQVGGTVRMQDANSAGYALGDMMQSSVWGGYQLLDWLSATLRGVYTVQGTIRGGFNAAHPTDAPVDHASNYGGRYWDVGFGLNATVPGGDLAGNHFAFEWLQPVSDDHNGYQLERESALFASWGLAF